MLELQGVDEGLFVRQLSGIMDRRKVSASIWSVNIELVVCCNESVYIGPIACVAGVSGAGREQTVEGRTDLGCGSPFWNTAGISTEPN